MASADLNCWNCGASLRGVPLPVGRGEECPECVSSIRACRGCGFYDANAANSCREPMADSVGDKEASNACDYFRPRTPGAVSEEGEAAASRAKLERLFGGGTESGPGGGGLAEEAARFPEREESEAEASRR